MNTNDTEKLVSRVMGIFINAVIFLTEWHLAMGILPLRRLCCGRIKLGDCEQQKSKRCLRETKFCDGDVLATHRRRKNTMRCFRETHPRTSCPLVSSVLLFIYLYITYETVGLYRCTVICIHVHTLVNIINMQYKIQKYIHSHHKRNRRWE